MIKLVPNSQSWQTIDSLIMWLNYVKDVDKKYLITGLKNSKKRGFEFRNLPESIELMDRYAYYIMTIPKKVSQVKKALTPKKWITSGMPSQFYDKQKSKK